MLELSKFFKNDIVGNSQTLKPVILITDPETNNVLFTLTQDKEELFDFSGSKINTISCIQKVSNVRLSTDYDTKTLKINRLRCTLYNYYDVKFNLSEIITDAISSKNLYLFYKSPTTNVIDIQNNLNDYDCALIYKGEISRLQFNDSSITILAEDKTQIKIANKKIPYMSIDKLDDKIKNSLTEKYKKNDLVVPMTFGKVDKAPCITYYEYDTNRSLNVLVDTFPTTETHKTSKIPSLLNRDMFDSSTYNYFMYVKQNNDYVILNHLVYTRNLQQEPYSRFELTSPQLSTNYEFPQLQADVDRDFEIWDFKGFQQRLAIGATAGTGSILDIKSLQTNYDEADYNIFNKERIYNNNGKPRIWYRNGDNLTTDAHSFNHGIKIYSQDSEYAEGRWIVVQLEQGASLDLCNIQVNGQWSGNTWSMCTYNIDGNFDDLVATNELPHNYGYFGYYVAPIASKIWKDLQIPNNITSSDATTIFNQIMVTKDEDIDNPPQAFDTSDPYEICTMRGNGFVGMGGSNNFWGEYNTANFTAVDAYINTASETWRHLNGLHYGQTGSGDNVRTASADSHNLIGIFEYVHALNTTSNHSYIPTTYIDGFSLVHSVVVDSVNQKELYLSITGRKNHLYTQQLIPEEYNLEVEYDLNYADYFNGTINDIDLLESFANITRTTYETVLLESDVTTAFTVPVAGQYGVQRTNVDFQNSLSAFVESKIWREYLSSEFINQFSFANAPPIVTSYALFEKIFEYYLIPTRVIKNLDAHKIFLAYDNYQDGPIPNAVANHRHFICNFHNLGWNPQGPTMQNSTNANYQNPTWSLSFAKYVYEYILQKDIDYDVNFETLIGYCGDFNELPNVFGGGFDKWKNDDLDYHIINLTSKIQEYKQYNWDSFEINSFDDWINNFYVYMDDLIQAINKALVEDYQDVANLCDIYGRGSFGPASEDYIYHNNINMDSWADGNQWIRGFSALDNENEELEQLSNDISSYTNTIISSDEPITGNVLGSGVIEKPSDIAINILVNELGYGSYFQQQNLGEVLAPNYEDFDMDSIIESRSIHNNWKMGFSVHKKTDGKKLIENILKESKSYPKFTNDGKFGLINIKESYTNDDIDVIINTNDILSYKFSETKREDITTFIKSFYRYDYGFKKYVNDYAIDINELLPAYFLNQNFQYNIKNNDADKELNLKYHTDLDTVKNFIKYKLLNDCNTHTLVDLKLSLNYINLTSGDIVYLPLIKNQKVYNIDYSKVYYKNSQPVYPLWLIMETNVGVDSISIKAYQLHYLGTDSNHGFEDIVVLNAKIQSYEGFNILGCTEQYSNNFTFNDGSPVPNSNYNPLANVNNEIPIPYFDLTGNTQVNLNDLNILEDVIAGNKQLTNSQILKLSYNADGSVRNIPQVGTSDFEDFLTDAYATMQELIEYNV